MCVPAAIRSGLYATTEPQTFNNGDSPSRYPAALYFDHDWYLPVEQSVLADDSATLALNVSNATRKATDDYYDIHQSTQDDVFVEDTYDGTLDVNEDPRAVDVPSVTSVAVIPPANIRQLSIVQSTAPRSGAKLTEYQLPVPLSTDDTLAITNAVKCACNGNCDELSASPIDTYITTQQPAGDNLSQPVPQTAVSAVYFRYPLEPTETQMFPWGFTFHWSIGFNAAANGLLYYQKVHTRMDLLDATGAVLHFMESSIVDIAQYNGGGSGGVIVDTQNSGTFESFAVNHVFDDRRVCSIRFERSATMRLVDKITVDPIGASGPRFYDPALDPAGMVHRHIWNSDGLDEKDSQFGAQLFEAITSPGATESYYLSWRDKVDSTIIRPGTFSLSATKVTKKGTLDFRFADEAALSGTVPGGIDRAFGPVTTRF